METALNAGAAGVVFMLIVGLLVIYFLPAIIALKRRHPYKITILTLNLFFGWTVLGWAIFFHWALKKQRFPIDKAAKIP